MKAIVFFGAALFALSPALADEPIESASALIDSCQVYVADESLKDHACKAFIVSFFEAYKKEQEDRQAALIQGREVDWSQPCIRMPDFVSFRDLAKLSIAKSQTDAKLVGGTAKDLLQAALVANYPCPPVDQGDAPPTANTPAPEATGEGQ